jgi:catechol 2,3-dioxygenase-like lactoylglutathione lyase family enzyme
MKLNHIDLQVVDVQRSVLFFERLFGFDLRSSRTSPAIGILDDGDGFTLVLQQRKHGDAYPDGFHIGFLVDDPEAVHAFASKARALGVDASDVIENGRGTLLYCRTEDGILVEVSCRRTRRG